MTHLRNPAILAAAIVACLILPVHAHADVYGYLDAQGMAHFSTIKLDQRYRLFLRGGDQPFEAADLGIPGKLSKPAAKSSGSLRQALLQHPNLKKYGNLLEQAAADFDLEPALLKAIMAAESGFNPGAISAKGAVGLMQVLPQTATRYGLHGDRKKTVAQKLADPKTNIRLAARYLHDLIELFPQRQDLVLASYNAGEGAVQRYDNKIPPYPETRSYVKLVTAFYEHFKLPLGRALSNPRPGRLRLAMPAPASLPVATEDVSTMTPITTTAAE